MTNPNEFESPATERTDAPPQPAAPPCCSTDRQSTCCDPSEKAACCGPVAAGGGCGCR